MPQQQKQARIIALGALTALGAIIGKVAMRQKTPSRRSTGGTDNAKQATHQHLYLLKVASDVSTATGAVAAEAPHQPVPHRATMGSTGGDGVSKDQTIIGRRVIMRPV